MRSGKRYLLHSILLSVFICGFMGTGCKKNDAPENLNVIRTPYSLYFADKLGSVYNTNDGSAYKIVFPADGVAARALTTSGLNLMFIKFNALINPNATLFLSSDDGQNFNPLDKNINSLPVWQNQVYDVPGWNLLYAASSNSSGIDVSQNHGLTWGPDVNFAPTSPASPQSFTQLTDGKMYAFDYTSLRLFEKLSAIGAWTEVTQNTPPPSGRFQLAHFNKTLVVSDLDGTSGIWYSDNNGVDWSQYAGIPTNHKIFMCASPHDHVLLAGVDSVGVYKLGASGFQASNNGLDPNTSVYGIIGKQDIYKNETIKQYVYIATSQGLFRSEDLGQNWVKMRPGEYRNVY